jgi:hypothetical protein
LTAEACYSSSFGIINQCLWFASERSIGHANILTCQGVRRHFAQSSVHMHIAGAFEIQGNSSYSCEPDDLALISSCQQYENLTGSRVASCRPPNRHLRNEAFSMILLHVCAQVDACISIHSPSSPSAQSPGQCDEAQNVLQHLSKDTCLSGQAQLPAAAGR